MIFVESIQKKRVKRGMIVIGIGPGKAGTTWLYHQLKYHKSLSFSTIKETNYFLRDQVTFDEYLKYFPDNGAKIKFEISNFYFKSETTLKKISQVIPNAKIIFFERNAIDRLISCYKFEVMQGYNGNVKEYLLTVNKKEFDNDAIYKKVSRWFDKENIFVVNFEYIKKQPQVVLDACTEFLEIDQILHDDSQYHNPSMYSRCPFMTRNARKLAKVFRAVGTYRFLQYVKSSVIIRAFFYSRDIVIISKLEHQLFKDFLSDP